MWNKISQTFLWMWGIIVAIPTIIYLARGFTLLCGKGSQGFGAVMDDYIAILLTAIFIVVVLFTLGIAINTLLKKLFVDNKKVVVNDKVSVNNEQTKKTDILVTLGLFTGIAVLMWNIHNRKRTRKIVK